MEVLVVVVDVVIVVGGTCVSCDGVGKVVVL